MKMKNGRLEYEINFSRRKLRDDITKKLRETYRHLFYDECLEIAEETIAQMQRNGKGAIYDAVLELCVKRAISRISKEVQKLPQEQYI